PGTINLAKTPNTPLILGDFAKSLGKITYTSQGAYYFSGLTLVDDPSLANVTTLQNLRASASNKALCVGDNGKCTGPIVLANPAPGTIGTLGRSWIEGPTHANFDVNVVKRFRIAEQKDFEVRVDAVNVMNNPRWSLVPSGTVANIIDINNVNFGK